MNFEKILNNDLSTLIFVDNVKIPRFCIGGRAYYFSSSNIFTSYLAVVESADNYKNREELIFSLTNIERYEIHKIPEEIVRNQSFQSFSLKREYSDFDSKKVIHAFSLYIIYVLYSLTFEYDRGEQ
jgi:hypothetical protein